MSKWDKLLRKLRNGSYDLAFEDLRKILINLGYIETYIQEERNENNDTPS